MRKNEDIQPTERACEEQVEQAKKEEMVQAQKDAAEERENEGGYQ